MVRSLVVVREGDVLLATENGYGKRTPVDEFPRHRRGGQGVIAIQTRGRNGPLVSAVQVEDEDEIMLITDGGTLVRTPVADVSRLGRNTQGVMLIRLSGDEKLVEMARIDRLEDDAQNESESQEEGSE